MALPKKPSFTIKVQSNEDNKYRIANLAVSFSKFTISSPADRTVNKNGDDLVKLTLWGIIYPSLMKLRISLDPRGQAAACPRDPGIRSYK